METLKRPPTLAEAAANSIRNAIYRGDYLPGDPLREIEISQTLNISRGTVREALRLLKNEDNLVEVIPYKGTFVTKLTTTKVKELYTLRALLESYAVRLEVENGNFTPIDIAELKALIVRLAELKKSDNFEEDIETDMKFHRKLSQSCNHQLLLSVLNSLQSQILIFILNTKLYRSDTIADDISHQAILDGILSGDPIAAEEVVRKHITDAGSALLNSMVKREAMEKISSN